MTSSEWNTNCWIFYPQHKKRRAEPESLFGFWGQPILHRIISPAIYWVTRTPVRSKGAWSRKGHSSKSKMRCNQPCHLGYMIQKALWYWRCQWWQKEKRGSKEGLWRTPGGELQGWLLRFWRKIVAFIAENYISFEKQFLASYKKQFFGKVTEVTLVEAEFLTMKPQVTTVSRTCHYKLCSSIPASQEVG